MNATVCDVTSFFALERPPPAIALRNLEARKNKAFHRASEFLMLAIERIRDIRIMLDEYGVGQVAMVGKARPDCVHVLIEGANWAVTTRWEADGIVQGDGLEAQWYPKGPMDRVRVGIRSRGGVAILSLRADGVSEVV